MNQEQSKGDQDRDAAGDAARPETGAPKAPRLLSMVMEVFGVSRGVTITVLLFVGIVVAAAIFFFIFSAPPTTMTITSGPEGSGFHTNAVRYAAILARYGIKARVLTSHGSLQNIERLLAPKGRGSTPSDAKAMEGRPSDAKAMEAGQTGGDEWADVGMVQSGVKHEGMEKLVSLGSVASQPLMVFYHGAPIEVLSELAGKRLAVGAPGSGTRALALMLLETNGIHTRPQDHKTTADGLGEQSQAPNGGPTNTTIVLEWEPRESYKALLAHKIDAAFLMGEDASGAMMRELLRTPDIHLFSFKQAAAYTRRFSDLSVLDLPEGSIDLGKDIPPVDIHLIGPTVELAARESLHPVLSDLLLEAAKEVHGRATVLQHKNQFPAPIEHDLRISPDAARWYKSGRSFFYRYLPFWLASIVRRVVVVFVPAIVVMIPILRSLPKLYQWRIRSRLYPWYRALLAVEGEFFRDEGRPSAAKAMEGKGARDVGDGGKAQTSNFKLQTSVRERLLGRLDEIERGVNRVKVPASFADQFYGLREHIDFVRELVEERTADRTQDH